MVYFLKLYSAGRSGASMVARGFLAMAVSQEKETQLKSRAAEEQSNKSVPGASSGRSTGASQISRVGKTMDGWGRVKRKNWEKYFA